MSKEGSGDVLMLPVETELGVSLWGACGVCEGGMVKSYVRGPEVEGVLAVSMSILF